jgi:hypothetical protein
MLEWLSIEVGVDENALVVTAEKPGFIKVAIAIVNAWVAPLALSQDQMAEVTAARQASRATTSSVSTLGTGHTGHGLHGGGGAHVGPLHVSSFGGAVSADDVAARHKASGLPAFLSLDPHVKGFVSLGSVGRGPAVPSLSRQGSIFDVGRSASSSGTTSASMPSAR